MCVCVCEREREREREREVGSERGSQTDQKIGRSCASASVYKKKTEKKRNTRKNPEEKMQTHVAVASEKTGVCRVKKRKK